MIRTLLRVTAFLQKRLSTYAKERGTACGGKVLIAVPPRRTSKADALKTLGRTPQARNARQLPLAEEPKTRADLFTISVYHFIFMTLSLYREPAPLFMGAESQRKLN